VGRMDGVAADGRALGDRLEDSEEAGGDRHRHNRRARGGRPREVGSRVRAQHGTVARATRPR
jgi:hypothetical protein